MADGLFMGLAKMHKLTGAVSLSYSALLFVNITTMPYFDDFDDQLISDDFINDAIVPHSNSIGIFASS